MLLSGGFRSGYFQIWDANNFKCIKLVRTNLKRIYMFLSLPCGYIACGMYDSVFDGSAIEIWYINEGQCINVLKTWKSGISSLLFKNNVLICATKNFVLGWGF
jgi:hypothetical protein